MQSMRMRGFKRRRNLVPRKYRSIPKIGVSKVVRNSRLDLTRTLVGGNAFRFTSLLRMLTRWSNKQKYSGLAYIVDGDTIRVNDQSIRLSGLDAPEMGQCATDSSGVWYDQGEYVKDALTDLIGGKHVTIQVESIDKYRRQVATVYYNGMDVCEWLVNHGYAVAAYGNQYKSSERFARLAKRGIWGDKDSINPQDWRRGNR